MIDAMDRHQELIRVATARALAEVEVSRLDATYRRLIQEAAQGDRGAETAPSMAQATVGRVLVNLAEQRRAGIAGAPLAAPAIELASEGHIENRIKAEQPQPVTDAESDMDRMVAAIRSSVRTITA